MKRLLAPLLLCVAASAQAGLISYHFKGHMTSQTGSPVLFEGDVTYSSAMTDTEPRTDWGRYDGTGDFAQGMSVSLTDGSAYSFFGTNWVNVGDNYLGNIYDDFFFSTARLGLSGNLSLELDGPGSMLSNDALPDGHWTEADFTSTEFRLMRPGVYYGDNVHAETGKVDYFRCTAGCSNGSPGELPEPASLALVLVGGSVAALARKRRHSARIQVTLTDRTLLP